MSNLAELLEKEKYIPWRNISGFQQCNFYSDIMLCCRDILLALKKSAFQAKLAKIGQFFVYNFAKK